MAGPAFMPCNHHHACFFHKGHHTKYKWYNMASAFWEVVESCFNNVCVLLLLFLSHRTHGGRSSVRSHHRPGSLLVSWVSSDWPQAAGAQRGRHGPADHAAAPGDPESPGSTEITPFPWGEPLHPLLLPSWRTGRGQNPGGVRCLCDEGWCVCVHTILDKSWTPQFSVFVDYGSLWRKLLQKLDTLQKWSYIKERRWPSNSKTPRLFFMFTLMFEYFQLVFMFLFWSSCSSERIVSVSKQSDNSPDHKSYSHFPLISISHVSAIKRP